MPNLYERGHRDGERGKAAATFIDHAAHDLWATHMLFHNRDAQIDTCGLDCLGLAALSENYRKSRRQLPDGLLNTRHTCGQCGAVFHTENRAAEREEYQAGYEAGRTQRAGEQQRRRNDQQRRARRGRRR